MANRTQFPPGVHSFEVSGVSMREDETLLGDAPTRSSTPNPAELSASVHKKLNWNLIPFGFLIVLLCYVDRSNLGFAANEFCADLKLTVAAYGTGAGMFYIGYATFQLPSNIILVKVGAPRWLGTIMIFWGVVATSMAFVTSTPEFYVVRLLLGFAEAGAFPGIWYYMTLFYPEGKLTLPLAALEMALILSTPISSPVAIGLLSLDGVLGFRGWQWLFLVEGALPVVLGVLAWMLLPQSPMHAKFLTQEERSWLVKEVARSQTSSTVAIHPVKQIIEVSKSFGYWAMIAITFIRDVAMNVVLYFTTLIIHAMMHAGDNNAEGDSGNNEGTAELAPQEKTCGSTKSLGLVAVGLTAVPYIFAAFVCLALGYISEKRRERSRLAGGVIMVCAIMFTLFPYMTRLGFGFGFVSFIFGVIGSFSPFPLIVSMAISFMPPTSKSMGLALFNTIAMLGGFVGPVFTGHVAQSSHKTGIEQYKTVIMIIGAFMFLGGLALFCIPDPNREKNAKIDEKLGEEEEEGGDA